MSDEAQGWSESDSEQFLAFGDVITPSRDEHMGLIADLVPAETDESFQLVELGCGGGELAAVLLERFPRARYLGLDGSPTMLRATGERLRPFGGRVTRRPFHLDEIAQWSSELIPPTRCFVSSLVVHHLTDDQKQQLYPTLYRCLEPGGGLILLDVVLPASRRGRKALEVNWDRVAREQSLAMTGSLDAYRRFAEHGWNYYADPGPDPTDMPASLFRQLQWLEAAGFRDVDCFWQRAGHALFGGYKDV